MKRQASDVTSWRVLVQSLPLVPGLFLLVLAACSLGVIAWLAGVLFAFLLLAAVGFIVAPLAEYLVHRYLMHSPVLRVAGLELASPLYRAHMQHHKAPAVMDDLVFGLKSHGLILLAIMSPMAAFGPSLLTLSLPCIWTVLVLRYECFHLVSHCEIRSMPGWLSRKIDHHRQHHAGTDLHAYAVSACWPDRMVRRRRC